MQVPAAYQQGGGNQIAASAQARMDEQARLQIGYERVQSPVPSREWCVEAFGTVSPEVKTVCPQPRRAFTSFASGHGDPPATPTSPWSTSDEARELQELLGTVPKVHDASFDYRPFYQEKVGYGNDSRPLSSVSTNVGTTSAGPTPAPDEPLMIHGVLGATHPSQLGFCVPPWPMPVEQHWLKPARMMTPPPTEIVSDDQQSRGCGTPGPGGLASVTEATSGSGPRPQHRKVFVGGVPQEMDQHDLHALFNEFGIVRKAWLQKCRANGGRVQGPNTAAQNHRGFGFIIFQDAQSINKLLGGQHVFSRFLVLRDGKKLEVKRAISSSSMVPLEPEPRKKGGQAQQVNQHEAGERNQRQQPVRAVSNGGGSARQGVQQERQALVNVASNGQPQRQDPWLSGSLAINWSMADGQQPPTLAPVKAWSFATTPPQAAAPRSLPSVALPGAFPPGNFHVAHPGVLQSSSIGMLMSTGANSIATHAHAQTIRRDSRTLSHELPALVEEALEEEQRFTSVHSASLQHLALKGTQCQLLIHQGTDQPHGGQQHGGQQQGAVAMIVRPLTPPTVLHQAICGDLSPVQMIRSGTPTIDMDQQRPSVLEAAHSRGGSREMSCKDWEVMLKNAMPEHYED